MTNKEEKAQVAANERASADEDARNAQVRTFDTPPELDPNSEVSTQRAPLSDIAPGGKAKWFHDASHSATAERLAAQRARDEAEWPPEKEADDK